MSSHPNPIGPAFIPNKFCIHFVRIPHCTISNTSDLYNLEAEFGSEVHSGLYNSICYYKMHSGLYNLVSTQHT